MVFIPETYKLLPGDMRPRGMYIGHSLSRCVTDILRGWMPLEKVKAIHSQTSASTLKEFTSLIEYYEKTRWRTVLQNDAHSWANGSSQSTLFDAFGAKYEPEMVWYIIGHIVSNNKLWQPRLDEEPENDRFPVAPGIYVNERSVKKHMFCTHGSTFVHGCCDVWESTARYKARLNSIGENDNG